MSTSKNAERKVEGRNNFSRVWIAFPIISLIAGPVTFVVGWIYAIREFGFFLGAGIGWIPALFIGYFVAVLTKVIMLAFALLFALKPLREVDFRSRGEQRENAPLPTSSRVPQLSLETRVKQESTKPIWAYMLWALGIWGVFGIHRFYLARHTSAIAQFSLALISLFLIGVSLPQDADGSGQVGPGGIFILVFASLAIWQFVDAFLIPGMIRERRAATRKRIISEMASAKQKTLTKGLGDRNE